MKQKWWKAAAALSLVALFAAGCGKEPSGGENGGGNDEKVTYEDYVSDKQSGGDSFDFEGNYTSPELTIDGLGNDEQWQAITQPLATFGKENAATVKIYRGESALFFLFEVSDTCLLTEGNANDDTVTRSDSIELYLDTLADGGSKPQSDDYQINLGIHGKTRIMQGAGSNWGNWNGLIDYEVNLKGTLNNGTEANDEGYSVEVMIPYSQIGIEKDDTVGISFGQVDKWGAGNSSGADWDWFGWTFEGTLREPQTIDNYVLLDKDNNLLDRDNQEKPDAVMAGYVYDSVTQAAVAGATVTAEIDGEAVTKTTDSLGFYSFDAVDPESNYTVAVTADGYYENSVVYTRAELRAADGGRVLKTVTLLSLSNAETVAVSGTVKNVAEGTVAGATVTVSGTSIGAVTEEDGTFTISDVPVVEGEDVTLVVSKAGYGDSETVIPYADLEGEESYNAGDLNLSNEWGSSAPTNFGLKSAFFANSSMKLARTLTGIEMRFEGTRLLSGHLEVYIDTAATGSDRNADSTCWCFNLNADGTLNGTHYTVGGITLSGGLEYELYYNESEGYSARFFIPYDYLGIQPLEVFGISLGQWSDSASDWDGWGWNGNNTAPENPQNYIRVDALNRLYKAANNNSVVTLSGNAGQAGVTVKVGASVATSGEDGSWTMSYSVPDTAAAISVSYGKQGYVSQTRTIEAGWFVTHLSWTDENVTLEEQKITVSGTVTDSITGRPVQGVTVSIEALNIETTTDAEGKYSLSNVTTYTAVTLTFAKENYETSEVSFTAAELAALNGPVDKALISTENVVYVTATGKVVDISGNGIANAEISLGSERLAETAQDGTFTVSNFKGADCTLTVTAEGYLAQTLSFKADDLAENAATYAFADVLLPLNYVSFAEGEVTDLESAAVTRSATGFEFKFTVGEGDTFAGNVQLFVDAGSSAYERNTSDYEFDISAAGEITIANFGDGSNTVKPEAMKATVTTENGKCTVYFTLPYGFLGVSKTDIIGISLGRNSATWYGWTLKTAGQEGANGSLYVAPEIPMDYMRVGVDNMLFVNAANVPLSVADLNDYTLYFGQDNDSFLAKATRGTDGITFDFFTMGDFGTSPIGSAELVLLYFDIGASGSGWDADYLVKIDSNGVVYGKNACWYYTKDGTSNKIGNVTIDRANGITKFSYTVSFATVGVTGADEIFGFALCEGWHTDADNSATYYGCMLKTESGFVRVITDAAATTCYIRVAADGTLYTAANNNPVSGNQADGDNE